MKASAIISVCNEGDELARTIARLHAATSIDIEIVVVDDGSNDGCCDDLDCDQLVQHSERIGVAQSRLDGMAAATGDCFVFLDGHHKFDDGCIDKIVALAMAKQAIVWPCIFDYSDSKADKYGHGALIRINDGKHPEKEGLLGNSWYSKNRPEKGGYSRAFGCLIPYAIPRAIADRVKWHRGMRGLGNSELAVAVKAFFTEVDIFHVCGAVSRHLFRERPPYTGSRWLHWLHNSALTARICFTEKTWRNHWWPVAFNGRHPELREEDYDRPGVAEQQVAFQKIKRRPDSELWRGLVHQPVPAGVSDT